MLRRLIADIASRLTKPGHPRGADLTAPDAAPIAVPADGNLAQANVSAEDVQREAQARADAGDVAGATALYLAGIATYPDNAALRVNASNIFKAQGKIALAREHLEHAVKLAPDLAGAWYNLGLLLQETWWLEEALDAFRHAYHLEKENGATPLCASLVLSIGLALQQCGQWRQSREFLEEVCAEFPSLAPEAERLALFTWVEDELATPVEKLGAYTRWAQQHADPLLPSPLIHGNDRDPDRPLRIGYVSGDFREHAVSYFFEPLLAHHNPKSTLVICYDSTRKTDSTTETLKRLAAGWRTVSTLSDDALAKMIRQDAIDILVDLSGHTAYNRLNTFALKPAPVQITWLGSRLTTGMAAMDYRLSDESVDPPGESDQWHRERVLRLRGSQWCYGQPHHAPAVAPLPLLSYGYATFGSFNQVDKLTDDVLDAWAEILRATPGSRLVMVGIPRGRYRDNLLATWKSLGIDTKRLDLYGYVKREQFLTIHGSVDIALDPFPYNGGTTTCESLWMGVPVVVMEGRSTLSRAGVSLLRAANLSDWIAPDRESYIQLAVEKAAQPELLSRLREHMRSSLKQSPLMDAALFAETFEDALRSVWRQWCLDNP
jgi:protein O-GlcNAc transferase